MVTNNELMFQLVIYNFSKVLVILSDFNTTPTDERTFFVYALAFAFPPKFQLERHAKYHFIMRMHMYLHIHSCKNMRSSDETSLNMKQHRIIFQTN